MSVQVLHSDISALSGSDSLKNSLHHSKKLLSVMKQVQRKLEEGEEGTGSTDGVEELKALKGTIKSQWNDKVNKELKQLNSKVRKLDKDTEKIFAGFDIDEVYNYRIEVDGDDEKSKTNKRVIQRSILIHLLRNGNFKQVENLSKEFAMSVPIELREKFQDLYKILNDLKRHDLDSAIEWCHANNDKLVAIGSDIEFEMYKLKFLQISQHDKYQGLKFVQQFANKFGFNHLDVMSKMILEINVYDRNDEVKDEAMFNKLSHEFLSCFCSIQGLSSTNPLYEVLITSYLSLPIFTKFNKLINLKKLDWSTKNELPFEITLPDFLKFHSIFICPVSREETTLVNPPRVLPCMHILSQSTVMSLSKNNINSSFKCPYCPKITRQAETKLVKFINI